MKLIFYNCNYFKKEELSDNKNIWNKIYSKRDEVFQTWFLLPNSIKPYPDYQLLKRYIRTKRLIIMEFFQKKLNGSFQRNGYI